MFGDGFDGLSESQKSLIGAKKRHLAMTAYTDGVTSGLKMRQDVGVGKKLETFPEIITRE
jgi:hypothetical protein